MKILRHLSGRFTTVGLLWVLVAVYAPQIPPCSVQEPPNRMGSAMPARPDAFAVGQAWAAGEAEFQDKTLSPYFLVKSDDPGIDQLPLKSTAAVVDITGVIADVKVTQVYKNEGTEAARSHLRVSRLRPEPPFTA